MENSSAKPLRNLEKLEVMREGGALLAEILHRVLRKVAPGVTLRALDQEADRLIENVGGMPSFKMVPNYRFATCINLNAGVVHGIPTERKIMEGDTVSVDISLLYKGYHTDIASTVIAGKPKSSTQVRFLAVGRRALRQALAQGVAGNRVGHISRAIQETIEAAGYRCVRALTGHGVGKALHEDPPIPCFLADPLETTPRLFPRQTLAVEVIYAQGDAQLKLGDDGWTLTTADGRLAALFEETVAIDRGKCEVLTKRRIPERKSLEYDTIQARKYAPNERRH